MPTWQALLINRKDTQVDLLAYGLERRGIGYHPQRPLACGYHRHRNPLSLLHHHRYHYDQRHCGVVGGGPLNGCGGGCGGSVASRSH